MRANRGGRREVRTNYSTWKKAKKVLVETGKQLRQANSSTYLEEGEEDAVEKAQGAGLVLLLI